MEFFEPVLGPILTLIEPKSLCEIGIDKGRFSGHLMQFCSQQDCRYTGIDPSIDGDLLKQKNNAEFKLMKCSSIEALHEIEPQDIYIIDGDHNYFTVKEELKLIFRHKENRPVLFFHDTGWPFGRRDLYYKPDSIPQKERQPYSTVTGPWPGKSELVDIGFCANESNTHIALDNGGPKNGVLTAIEDGLSEQIVPKGYHLQTLPILFGCSILYPANSIPQKALKKLVELENGTTLLHPTLELMETNRMTLYLHLLASWEKFEKLHNSYEELMKGYKELMDQYGDLHDHSDKLLGAYKDLKNYKDSLEAQLKNNA